MCFPRSRRQNADPHFEVQGACRDLFSGPFFTPTGRYLSAWGSSPIKKISTFKSPPNFEITETTCRRRCWRKLEESRGSSLSRTFKSMAKNAGYLAFKSVTRGEKEAGTMKGPGLGT